MGKLIILSYALFTSYTEGTFSQINEISGEIRAGNFDGRKTGSRSYFSRDSVNPSKQFFSITKNFKNLDERINASKLCVLRVNNYLSLHRESLDIFFLIKYVIDSKSCISLNPDRGGGVSQSISTDILLSLRQERLSHWTNLLLLSCPHFVSCDKRAIAIRCDLARQKSVSPLAQLARARVSE